MTWFSPNPSLSATLIVVISVLAQPAPAAAQQRFPEQYCGASGAFYPEVKTCAISWQQVSRDDFDRQREVRAAARDPNQRQLSQDIAAADARLVAAQRRVNNMPNCAECAGEYQIAIYQWQAEIAAAQSRYHHRLECRGGAARQGTC